MVSTSIGTRARSIPSVLPRRVRATEANLGLAFDGDGDRLIAVDEAGEVRDGDYALAICGRHLGADGRLKGDVVVTTVMANLGLDKALAATGIRTVKTQVGDRYVLEEMSKRARILGASSRATCSFSTRRRRATAFSRRSSSWP